MFREMLNKLTSWKPNSCKCKFSELGVLSTVLTANWHEHVATYKAVHCLETESIKVLGNIGKYCLRRLAWEVLGNTSLEGREISPERGFCTSIPRPPEISCVISLPQQTKYHPGLSHHLWICLSSKLKWFLWKSKSIFHIDCSFGRRLCRPISFANFSF